MDRRDFLVSTSTLLATSIIVAGCGTSSSGNVLSLPSLIPPSIQGAYQLPPLPYEASSLEPYIDTATMKLHHDVHHAAYVKNLNAALSQFPELTQKPLEALLSNLSSVPEVIREAVRNHGGGHYNHSLFWESMSRKGKSAPTGALERSLTDTFGGLKNFKDKFQDAGMKRFGSGWVWLVKSRNGSLEIMTTANQDTPLAEGYIPLLGNDLWEHAYYLKYQSKRADYLSAWWNVVDWAVVEIRFLA